MKNIYLYLFSILIISCRSSAQNNKLPYEENQYSNLYMFIGEKISIAKIDRNKHERIRFIRNNKDTLYRITIPDFDEQYLAKYKILKKVYNDLKTDTASFYVTDPVYKNEKYVLIYLSKSANGLYYNPHNEYEKVTRKHNHFILENQNSNYLIKRRKGISHLIYQGY